MLFISLDRGWKGLSEGDVFIGYHADTAASVVLQVSRLTEPRRAEENTEDADDEQDEDRAGKVLIVNDILVLLIQMFQD